MSTFDSTKTQLSKIFEVITEGKIQFGNHGPVVIRKNLKGEYNINKPG